MHGQEAWILHHMCVPSICFVFITALHPGTGKPGEVELGGERRCTVSDFKGKRMVDLREWYRKVSIERSCECVRARVYVCVWGGGWGGVGCKRKVESGTEAGLLQIYA
jgi:hypothetical protein